MMKRRKSVHIAVILCFACTQFGFAQKKDSQSVDKKALITKAREAYYALNKLGFEGYTANIAPDWPVTLGTDPEKVPPILNAMHFSVDVDREGKATTLPKLDIASPNEQVQAAFDQISNGMEQSIALFHQQWAMFTVATPFPEPNDDYQLDETASGYRCSFTTEQTAIVILMSKDFAIQEVQLTAPDYKSSIRPQFEKTAKGLLLTGYNADYLPKSETGTVYLRADFTSQEVQGMQLPQNLTISTMLNNHPSKMALSFADAEAKVAEPKPAAK